MQTTHNTLPEMIRLQSIELLNRHLAAAIDLHGQAKQAHWNVRGPGFIAIHELFDRVSEDAEKYSDMLAERVGGLGGTAQGTIQAAVARTFLIAYDLGVADEESHIFAVSAALAAFSQSTRESISIAKDFGDVVTADMFTEISRGVDKQLWFVESHAAPRSPTPNVVEFRHTNPGVSAPTAHAAVSGKTMDGMKE